MTWEHFSRDEIKCRCGCGRMEMDDDFMQLVVALRKAIGIPLPVSSGYRCPEYNDRISGSGTDGPHTTGKAIDLQVSGKTAHEVLRLAMALGFRGIGINQKGDHRGRFVHLDMTKHLRPWVWSY